MLSLFYSLLSVIVVSVFALSVNEDLLHRILFFAWFSGGSILGVAFLDLLPEAIELGVVFGSEVFAFIFILTFCFLLFLGAFCVLVSWSWA